MRILCWILIVLSFNACTFHNLRKRDWILQGVLVAEATTDGLQTRYIVANNDEVNPFVGSNGNRVNYVAFGIIAVLLEFAVATSLPDEWRSLWEGAAVGIEGEVVYNNFLNGCYPWGYHPTNN